MMNMQYEYFVDADNDLIHLVLDTDTEIAPLCVLHSADPMVHFDHLELVKSDTMPTVTCPFCLHVSIEFLEKQIADLKKELP